MRFQQSDSNDRPDDRFNDLLNASGRGDVEAYGLVDWPGQRFIDSVSFRRQDSGASRVEHVSLGHGRRWSNDLWVAITTWQSASNRAALPLAARRSSVGDEYEAQVRDWEVRGLLGLPHPDPTFRDTFEGLGFEYLGQFGPMTCLFSTADSGAVIGIAGVGEMGTQELAIAVCSDLAPYVEATRIDMERRLRIQP